MGVKFICIYLRNLHFFHQYLIVFSDSIAQNAMYSENWSQGDPCRLGLIAPLFTTAKPGANSCGSG